MILEDLDTPEELLRMLVQKLIHLKSLDISGNFYNTFSLLLLSYMFKNKILHLHHNLDIIEPKKIGFVF